MIGLNYWIHKIQYKNYRETTRYVKSPIKYNVLLALQSKEQNLTEIRKKTRDLATFNSDNLYFFCCCVQLQTQYKTHLRLTSLCLFCCMFKRNMFYVSPQIQRYIESEYKFGTILSRLIDKTQN